MAFLKASVIFLVVILSIIIPVSAGESALWIDPVHGSDTNNGASPSEALLTIRAGLDRIPRQAPLVQGYHLMLMPGDYDESSLPADGYIEGISATEQNPVTLEASGGKHTAVIHGNLDIQKSSWISFLNLDLVTDPGKGSGGNVLHLASDDHILIRGCTLDGFDGNVRQPQETLKANQVRDLRVEDSDISGADWYSLDFVAVHGGHIIGSRIHDAGEFALLIKGGSADIRIEGNDISSGRTGGVSAGSGTGFDYFVSPYLHYEVYDTRIVNNIIHDNGVAVSVNGGYNILVAHNTLYRNTRFLEVMHGRRGCEGDTSACERNQRQGGWGTTGGEGEYIPSANVFVFNNIMYSPAPPEGMYEIFTVQAPVNPPAGSNVPSPSAADRNLRISGNVAWNGAPDMPVFNDGGGCTPANTACNEQQVRTENRINTEKPDLAAADRGDYSLSGGNIPGAACFAIPPFPNDDRPASPPVPSPDPDNSVSKDYYGTARKETCVPGAILSPGAGNRVPDTARTVRSSATQGQAIPSAAGGTATPAASLSPALSVAGMMAIILLLNSFRQKHR